ASRLSQRRSKGGAAMNDVENTQGRSRFTLSALVVLVTVIALVFAVLVLWFRQAREDARRTQCMNNLQQIGLGIHNFHDIRQEICPSYITDDHSPAALPKGFVTWPVFLMAFITAVNDFDRFDLAVPLDKRVPPGHQHEIARKTQWALWICLTRRGYP